MKIRNGFVSNSSSSSFIIAYLNGNDIEVCPTCGTKIKGLLKIVETSDCEDTYLISEGAEAAIAQAAEWYHDSGEREVELVHEIEKYRDRGYGIAVVSISNHDEYAREMLYGTSENMIILDSADY